MNFKYFEIRKGVKSDKYLKTKVGFCSDLSVVPASLDMTCSFFYKKGVGIMSVSRFILFVHS